MGRPKPAVRALAAVVGIEALGLIAIALLLLVLALLGHGDDPLGSQLLLAAIPAAGGTALLAVVRGLLARRRWSRAPSLLTQLLTLPVGWALVGTQAVVGVAMIVVAAAALGLLLAPAGGGQLER